MGTVGEMPGVTEDWPIRKLSLDNLGRTNRRLNNKKTDSQRAVALTR